MQKAEFDVAGLTSVLQQLWCLVCHPSEACLFSGARVHGSQRIISKKVFEMSSFAIETRCGLQESLRERMELLSAPKRMQSFMLDQGGNPEVASDSAITDWTELAVPANIVYAKADV